MNQEFINRNAYKKNGFMIYTMPLQPKVGGFIFNFQEVQAITVNSKLPKAKRGAIIRDLMTGGGVPVLEVLK